ncbi:MAG: MBL fold metallo-hydrolase [Sphingobacterium sp.]|uniref:MBL fold metallo-hydrolase n=1 Tax=Sphingobacterium sp. JB170 TaxID=1434842 RepID=UPI00097EDDF6|nr:MBL fold metallo-hydrolase [Sphingobacterium sp. JB170]SJN29586.1 mRNA 3-end processing factor [Sphingobacterium sp. JB170]
MLQIIDDFVVRCEAGYYCRYGDFYIDAMRPVPRNIVSHAHGDHATTGHKLIIATRATLAFMRNKFSRLPEDTLREVAFGEHFKFGEVDITLIPAGHILGSAQLLMIYKGVRYLYTGDYKMQEDPTCEQIEIVKTDVLITETTFANPLTKHPDIKAEILKMKDRPSNIMLGCYVLGKAQRLTALINKYLPEREVLVHFKMHGVHKIYQELGFVPLKYNVYNRKLMREGEPNKIYLVPPLTFNSYFKAKNVIKAFASGWERLQKHNDIELYISDHVDWDDLLHYIELVHPKQVWTIHGDGRALQLFFADSLTVRDIIRLKE